MGKMVEFEYPDGTKVLDEDWWLFFGEMTVADMHTEQTCTENLKSPYLYENGDRPLDEQG